ncbi:wall-associated receptor kinase-like 8 [Silene latifolia]|uniref:wall-associated receptor kinase-like 8 n=1 Tax=Silene latifolia TaxID=37657 RepID=UPI003D77FCAE
MIECPQACCLVLLILHMLIKTKLVISMNVCVNMHYFLWQILILSSILATLSHTKASVTPTNIITARNTTKPGCQRKCGDLTIPYPFGIGYECYQESWFGIVCDTSFNPPRAFLMVSPGSGQNHYILQITETKLMMKNSQIASTCYESKLDGFKSGSSYDSFGPPFTYSSTANKLTVVGCDDYAFIYINDAGGTGTLSEKNNASDFRAGCIALCSNPNETIRGSCSGLGCCQSSLPPGLKSFDVVVHSLQDATIGEISPGQPCGYAFLAGNSSFNFSGASDLNTGVVPKRVQNQVPLVLDWSMGHLDDATSTSVVSCNEAKKNASTYICQSNSKCIDSDAGGYNCNCLSGFEGNPYLFPGCTDVDECAAGSNSPCSTVCINTPGSYKCRCPDGFYGDGLKSGIGCFKIVNTSFKKVALGLGISLGAILTVLIGWWLNWFIKRRKIIRQKVRNFERNGGLLLKQQIAGDETVAEIVKVFSADELDRATDHFNENRILGQGGQGIVYKGMLGEGRIVAIKKSKGVDQCKSGEFINEVVILSQINHRNIVKLLGCCLEAEVPLLVYEFIPNGTLFHHIHYPSDDFQITWKMRLQIACDSAGALAYLHSSSSIPIFHRDIKSSNILLDEKYKAKLSDFGTSRTVNIDQTHVTTRVMGTFGYLDPEYFQSSQFTEKSDVYSFGVVLVELLTGQKAIRSIMEEDRSLTSWFLTNMDNSTLLDIIDTQVLQEGSKEEFFTIANLAKRCLNLDGKKRPYMKEVLTELEGVRSLHLPGIDEQKWPESKKQVMLGTTNMYNDGITNSSSFCIKNSSSSAEFSLLFNPR